MINAEEIISLLNLKPHLEEGGHFAETYRSEECLSNEALSSSRGGSRSLSTAIYYLQTPESFSAMHRLWSDEVFHVYVGDPVEMLQLWPDGSGHVMTLGPDISGGMRPQLVVLRGIWQGLRLLAGGSFALLGTTVAPGFEYADYEHGSREGLIGAYPGFRDRITSLTRE